MTAPQTIKVGVVGLSKEGWGSTVLVGPLLAPPLSEKYRLTALSTTSASSANESAQKYSEIIKGHVKAYYGDTSHISTDEEVDMVVITVKATAHKDTALPAIEAGKDIFLEWPCGRNLEETRLLRDAARRRGVRTMVGLQGWQSPLVPKVFHKHSILLAIIDRVRMLKLKELIASGAIGRVLSTSVMLQVPKELDFIGPVVPQRYTYTTDASNGATFLDIPVGHFLNCFTQVFGEFESVTAITRIQYPSPKEVDATGSPTGRTITQTSADQVAFIGVLKSGVFVNVHARAGMASKGKSPFIWVIDGEEGTIKMEGDGPRDSLVSLYTPPVWLNGEPVIIEEHPLGNIGQAWSEFAKGTQGSYPTLDDAVALRTLLAAIKESAQQGKTIKL